MDKKSKKSFTRVNIIICIITLIVIGAASWFMKDMEWWKFTIILFIIMICSMIASAYNFVFHIRKK